jgi:hypothetical protein
LLSSLLLKIGVINATFKLSGIIPDENDKLKICVKGLEISLAIIFIILALMPSYPELFRLHIFKLNFKFIFCDSIKEETIDCCLLTPLAIVFVRHAELVSSHQLCFSHDFLDLSPYNFKYGK